MRDKLRYENDWECDKYFVGKTPVQKLTKVTIDDVPFDVVTRNIEKPYSDHGHTYYARSDHFFITVTVGGIVFERDLNTLARKKIIAIEWS